MRASIAAALTLALIGPAQAAPVKAEDSRAIASGPDGRIAYQTCGSGPRTLVLLHDGIVHSVGYDDVWAALCAKARVIRYDRRGYGASPPSAKPYFAASDLALVLKAAGVEHATLVGASAGAAAAVDFTLAHPEAVDGLVLVSPSLPGFKPSLGGMARSLALKRKFDSGDIEGAANDPHVLAPGSTARPRVVAWLKASPGNVAAGQNERYREDPRPRLKDIKAPILILVGQGDHKDVLDQAEAIGKLAPAARRVVVPTAGHLLYLDQPARFVAEVLGAQ